MIGRRKSPDGLPFRLYMSEGKRTISFGYKDATGKWVFRYSAPRVLPAKVAEVRQRAIDEANKLNDPGSTQAQNVTYLIDRYFKWQDDMPLSDERRKAVSTLKENKRERKWLDAAFGKMTPKTVAAHHIYKFLDMRGKAAPAKANKEIALLSAVFEYGRRIGEIAENTCRGIEYNPTRPKTKLVKPGEIDFMLKVAREMGGQYIVQGLCAKAAYHAVGRPDEMRLLRRNSIKDEGVEIPVGKRKKGQVQRHKLAEWNGGLRAAIDEAKALQKVASVYVFANARGGGYNRNSWSNIWQKLMDRCEVQAVTEGIEFARFTLSDMRPMSVTKRMREGDTRITDATGHSDDKMANKVYDRREVKRFKATE